MKYALLIVSLFLMVSCKKNETVIEKIQLTLKNRLIKTNDFKQEKSVEGNNFQILLWLNKDSKELAYKILQLDKTTLTIVGRKTSVKTPNGMVEIDDPDYPSALLKTIPGSLPDWSLKTNIISGQWESAPDTPKGSALTLIGY